MRRASPDALLAVLRAVGAPVEGPKDVPRALREKEQSEWRRPLDPVIAAWERKRVHVDVRVPTRLADDPPAVRVELEDGASLEPRVRWKETGRTQVGRARFATLRLSMAPLPIGYHHLHVELRGGGGSHQALVVCAPVRCFDTEGDRAWGAFLPLYALRSARNWGAGDLTDLGALIEWVRKLGGRVVGTLPLLAAFLDDPFDPSPYAPASRLFWNDFYVDPTRAPEFERSAEARGMVSSPEIHREIDQLRREPHVDFRRGMAVRRAVLEAMSRAVGGERRAELERFVAARPALRDYARFRSAVERSGKPWTEWRSAARGPFLDESDVDPDAVRYHLYVQWLAHEQLESLAGEEGLFLDLPLGVHPAGYDTWREREAFAAGVWGGAPPDPFFTAGQDWGFPPLHPQRIREQEYRYPIACLRHLMRHAGAIRIDHVMWMHRMFWVPKGMEARDGVYVSYPEEELYAILALESHRNRTVMVGEDLGTVPKAVRRSMGRHGAHRIYVLQYELRPYPRKPLAPVPERAQVSLNTHDMPTFAAMWEGLDIEDRMELGLLDEAGVQKERAHREKQRVALVRLLRTEGWLTEPREPTGPEAMRACQRFLAASPARTLLVNLEDLWSEHKPQNMPGTGRERPNWTRKAARDFEEFRDSPAVLGTFQELNELRKP